MHDTSLQCERSLIGPESNLRLLSGRFILILTEAGNAIRTRDIHLGKVTLYH
ncbi:MAG: hypothetical protein GFH24_608438n22 [Chloroflexi bacterium AL-N5]|nr:hypothetical protein [Chloroflexi bacterium AL-N5]